MSISLDVKYVYETDYWNCRTVSDVEVIKSRVTAFVDSVIQKLDGLDSANSILILGTEEYMFPGMMLGSMVESIYPDKKVRFHATTRSPIEISADNDYPLHSRTPLESFYGNDRRTFIYNLDKYDKVIVVTDANPVYKAGLSSLVGALEQCENRDITVIQWGDFHHEK